MYSQGSQLVPIESRGAEWEGKSHARLPSAALICKPSVGQNRFNLRNPANHLFNLDDGILLANVIDIALDPDVGLDEDRDNRDADADMELDGCASIKYSCDRDLGQQRDVDGSTDVNQRSSRRVMLATGNNRVVVTCPRNQVVHSSQDLEDREGREKEKCGRETHSLSEIERPVSVRVE